MIKFAYFNFFLIIAIVSGCHIIRRLDKVAYATILSIVQCLHSTCFPKGLFKHWSPALCGEGEPAPLVTVEFLEESSGLHGTLRGPGGYGTVRMYGKA